jgi:transposase
LIGLSRAVRVWVHREPVDMRKSFDTLAAVVRLAMGKDILQGELFVFVGKRRRTAKVLYWDGTGLCLFSKRLSKSRFTAPWQVPSSRAWTLSELSLFLEGSEYVGRLPLSPEAWHPESATLTFS